MEDPEKVRSEALKARSRERLAACEKMDLDAGVRLVRSQDAIRRSLALLEKTRWLLHRR